MATEAEWRAAYEGKIDDLRRETHNMDLDANFVDAGGGCPYPEGECNCGNGIGCVNVPVGEW